jgi:D-threo-aldose 1-dehydrogenase
LRFPLAHSSVISIVPGPRTPGEVQQAIETLSVNIPDALWSDLRAEGLLRGDAPVPGGAP